VFGCGDYDVITGKNGVKFRPSVTVKKRASAAEQSTVITGILRQNYPLKNYTSRGVIWTRNFPASTSVIAGCMHA
jgi:hypothetical protein